MGQEVTAAAQKSGILDLSRQGQSAIKVTEAFKLSPEIKVVDLSFNRIVCLPPDQTSVETLRLVGNKLEKLNDQMMHAFATAPKLASLDLSKNLLTSVNPVVFLIPSLRWLSLFENNLTEVAVECSYIEELDLGMNKLAKFPVIGPSVLKLSLDFNLLTTIDRSIECVKVLSLSGNRISSIDPKVCFPQLEVLDISRNAFMSLPDLSKITPSLKILDFSRNTVHGVGDLPKTLRKIFASYNRLESLPNLDGMNALTVIDFSHNLLAEVRKLPVTLHVLNLANNVLSYIEDCDLPELVWLSLERNKLESMPKFNGNQCTELSFYGNKLASINLAMFFAELCFLDLSNNQIETLPSGVFGLSNLFSLNVSRNKLRFISEKIIKSPIVHLNLSDNPLERFPAVLPTTLERLEAAYCGLTSIPMSILECCELIELDLSGNELTEIPLIPELLFVNLSRNRFETFPFLSQRIQTVDISCNNLTRFHRDFQYPEMTHLDLSYNEQLVKFPVGISLDSLVSLSVRGTKLYGKLHFPSLRFVDATGTSVTVAKQSVSMFSSVKCRVRDVFVQMTVGPPGQCCYATNMCVRDRVNDIISVNARSRIYCIANGNDMDVNKAITEIVSKLDKKPDLQKSFAELGRRLYDTVWPVPTCFCCAMLGSKSITVRFGPVDVRLYDAEGVQLFSMRSYCPLSTAPDFPLGPSNFPDLEPGTAVRAARGDIPSNWDDALTTVEIPVLANGKWLVMATSICFQLIHQDAIQQLLKSASDVKSIAYDIRNRAIASNFSGNVSVIVIDVTNMSEVA